MIFSSFAFTFKAKAYTTSISASSISGPDSVTIGQNFSQSVSVNFSDLKKDSLDTLGIWLVAYEVEYDESVFVMEEISSERNAFESMAYREDDKVYVISELNNDSFKTSCIDGLLYCADYITSIRFYVKDTDKTSSTIKIKQISAGAFPVSGDLNPTYLINDMIELEYDSEVVKVININKSANTNIEEPKSIITNSHPKIETPKKTISSSNTPKPKSNNKYLKTLSIENHGINFSKENKNYNIYIKDDINTLDIIAIPEDENATIEITGADNLVESNYKVSVKVKAQNGEEEIYYINAIKEDVSGEKKDTKKTSKPSKKIIIIVFISCILLIIGILAFIIKNHIANKKIDEFLDL